MSFNLEDSIDTIFTIPIVTVKHTHEKKIIRTYIQKML